MGRVEELKFRAIYLASNIVLPDITIVAVENPSSESAQNLEHQGKWIEAARHYQSLSEKAELPDALHLKIDIAQQLINLGRFRQASEILNMVGARCEFVMDLNQKRYVLARVLEKKAWIDDYLGRFDAGITNLQASSGLLDGLTAEEVDVTRSTIVHFTARAHAQRAEVTGNREDIELAMVGFAQDANRFYEMRQNGNPVPANEAFNYAWMTRVMTIVDEKRSFELLRKSMALFREASEGDPASGFGSHARKLEAGVYMRFGYYDEARASFGESLAIEQKRMAEGKGFPKGLSDAYLGLALTRFKSGDPLGAGFAAFQGATAYPYAMLH